MYQQQGMMGYPPAASATSPMTGSEGSQSDTGTGMRPDQEAGGNADMSRDQQPQQAPQQPYAWGQPPFYQPWNWNVPQFGAPFQYPGTRMGQVYLRITAGMCLFFLVCDFVID